MDKKFIVISDDGQHDYNVIIVDTDKGKEYSIFYSEGSQWHTHVKGELILKMTNTGDGVVFDRKIGKNMDYHELLPLHILLTMERCIDPQGKYQIIEDKSIIEI